MKPKPVILIILAITLTTIAGCCLNSDQTDYNNNYPNITIVDVRSANYDHQFIRNFHNATILVTVKNIEPEKTTKYANGSVSCEGNIRTVPIIVSTEDWWMVGERGYEHITRIQNVSLAYNETKTLNFNVGDLHRGLWNFTVSTPNMTTIVEFSVDPMGY